ncbi:MAG: cytochrome c assembly protein [Dehalococcoidales bacterium]|nr:cytochrome c assembly protein [Dehalococcoidales bacterium]
MNEIGYIALILALVVSIYAVFAFSLGVRRQLPELIASARNSVYAVFGLVSLSVAVLLYALVNHDFRLAYVASYTSRDLSLFYLISGWWAGNDGSLLFWVWILALAATVVVRQKRNIGQELVPYATSVLMVVAAFFFFLLVAVANPFQKLSFVPADGQGLNPLLENPGMLIHPPTLLTGYALLAVPFAFAIAAMLSRRLGDEWIILARRWALIAWLSLGIGNVLGAWWAYVELGWGGYWAWDPVENASLLPWLTATAFLHSVMMQRRRGILKVWNMVLIIITFSLSLFGTFLTRSGILASVHSFSDTSLGIYFLVFIGLFLFGSLVLLYYRSDELKGEAEMESLVSRESTFLLNNLLLVGAAFAIFLGTVFPVITEAVRGVKITVGPPFFNQVNAPIFLAIILLAGICTLIGWRRASPKNLLHNFLLPVVLAVVLAIVLFIIGVREWYVLLAFFICSFVPFTIIYEWLRGTSARHRTRGENYLKAFWGLIGANRPRYGGYIVHLGIVLIALGVTVSSVYNIEKEATLTPGESMTIRSYTLTYDGKDSYETASKRVVSATVSVYQSGEFLGKMVTEKYFHKNYEQAVTEVAIRSTLVEDLYLIFVGEDQGNVSGATAFKVLVNPMVAWIWLGGAVVILGGLIAFWPQRRGLTGSARV